MTTHQSLFDLNDVVDNSELVRRPSRPPDHEAENNALIALAQTMADAPEMILQKLAETALQLCQADSAGIGLLKERNGVEVFSWEVFVGRSDDRPNEPITADATLCRPSTHNNTVYRAEEKTLLIPFDVDHKPIGIICVVAHDANRNFDREDERIVRRLAQFASAAWQLWKARAAADAAVRTEHQRAVESAAANEALQFQIGEGKRAEDQLQQLNNDLERRMTDGTRDLLKAIADLTRTHEEGERLQEQLRQSQKMASIGTLAGGLAHDFNNLLHVIQGYASLIIEHPDDPAWVIEVGGVVVRTVDQGAALARQLLTISRKSEPKLDPTDLNGLLRGLTKLLSEIFPKTVTIALDLDAKIPNVMADANQINQALLNLCVNARDAMADGGNLLLRTRTISGAELRARFRDAKAERYAWMSVADTGLGMEEEIRRRVFEPFFTTKDPEQGTGLGLSVTYGIVNNQNGFIDVVSEPGRGSTFNIFLPIPKEPAALAEATETFEGKKAGGRAEHIETLLFVEDEPRQLQIMQSFLKGEGFTVLTARDGAEAVEVHRRFKDEIALVILDLGLAKLNGWEAFQMMKKLNPQLKGILASGYLSSEVDSQVAKGALSGVVKKPYQPGELLAKIEGAIRSA